MQRHPQQRVFIEIPGPRALAHLDPVEVLLVAGADPVDQPLDRARVEAAAAQRLADLGQPRLRARIERGRGQRQRDRPHLVDRGGDPRQHPAVAARERREPEAQREPAEHAARHRAEVDVEPRAARDRLEVIGGEHRAHEAALVEPQRLEPLAGDPVPRHLDPGVVHAPGPGRAPAPALALLELHLGDPERAVEARAVGDRRPQGRGRDRDVEVPEPLEQARPGEGRRPRVAGDHLGLGPGRGHAEAPRVDRRRRAPLLSLPHPRGR